MIKKGLKVRVLTGKDKKKEGEVIEIDRANNEVIIKYHCKNFFFCKAVINASNSAIIPI